MHGSAFLFISLLFLVFPPKVNPAKAMNDYHKKLQAGLEKYNSLGREWSLPQADPCFVNTNFTCQVLVGNREWKGGCGPGFIVFGSPKSGTTSVYEYLSSHPQVVRALSGVFDKEVRFFSEWFGMKKIPQYLMQFPPVKRDSVSVNNDTSRIRVMSGEASPTYMFDLYVPERIKAVLPKVKLIVLLRNPVERAYSYWKMRKHTDSKSKLSFEEEVEFQMKTFESCYRVNRLSDKYEMMEKFLSCFGSPARNEYKLYLLASIYVFQFQNWLRHFPREQMMVITTERFQSETNQVMEEITEFLGLCPIDWTSITSVSHNKRKFMVGVPMSNTVREKLRHFFAPFNKLLEAELQRKFPEWDDISLVK